jgi:hypothetical protein
MMINVVQEQIERRDSLDQSALDEFPFLRGNDARHEVERKHALRSARIAIHIERHALPQKCEVNGMALGGKFFGGQS